LHDWFSLEGNPDPQKTWTRTTLDYLDADGQPQLLEIPLTPAHFAQGEIRFKKQFRTLAPDDTQALPVEAFVDLPKNARAGQTPFIWATDAGLHLVRLAVSDAIVALVEERRKYWHLLQYLDGQQVTRLDASLHADMALLQKQVQDSATQRDSSLDSLARAMSELASASKSPAGRASVIPIIPVAGLPAASAAPAALTASAAAGAAPLLTYSTDDQLKCTDCKTCYQELPELFEATRIIVGGEAKNVARLIPGALEQVPATPELRARIQRVVANCDAEIIQ
jgi:pyruvate-ferredoxin/flavodoxin oxidoreductase